MNLPKHLHHHPINNLQKKEKAAVQKNKNRRGNYLAINAFMHNGFWYINLCKSLTDKCVKCDTIQAKMLHKL